MSTDDWKAELRRRIEQIKEKKAADGESGRRMVAPATAGAAAPAMMPSQEPAAATEPEEYEEAPPAAAPDASAAEEVGREAELAAPETALEEEDQADRRDLPEEPTLFPAEPEIDSPEPDGPLAIAVEGREQPTADSAAPVAPDLDASLDHYTPLDHQLSTQNEEREQLLADPAPAPSREEEPQPVPYALCLRRALAAVTDGVVLAAIEAGLVMVAGVLLNAEPALLLTRSYLPLAGMFLCLHFLYYVLFTSMTGQTPGKRLLGLRVAGRDRGVIGMGAAVARWLAVWLAVLPLGIGYFWMFARPDGRAWHDLLLRMRVERYRA